MADKVVGQLAPNSQINLDRRPAFCFFIAVYDDGLDGSATQNVEMTYGPMERITENGPVAKNRHPSELEMFIAMHYAQSILATHTPEIQEHLRKQAEMFKQMGSDKITQAMSNREAREMMKNLKL